MRQYHSHSVEQDVEWLYSFDVHANAFFCSFLLTYVLQVHLLTFPADTSYFYPMNLTEATSIVYTNPPLYVLILFFLCAQYFFLPMLLSRSIFACIFSNTLYAVATVWYAYITHLGYRGNYLFCFCFCFNSFRIHVEVCCFMIFIPSLNCLRD